MLADHFLGVGVDTATIPNLHFYYFVLISHAEDVRQTVYQFSKVEKTEPIEMAGRSWSPLPDLNRGHPDVC